MIELPTLYEHQTEHKDRARASLLKNGRVIVQASPGVGKTRMAKWILGSALNRTPNERQSGRSLFAVYGRGLVDNATASFDEDPALPYGVIMSDRERAYGYRLQVSSIDSLMSWFIDKGEWNKDITFDIMVLDEVHAHLPKFRAVLDTHDARREQLGLHPAYVIGLTATPQCKGLAEVFRDIVSSPSTDWLIENKFLSPFRYFLGKQGQLGKLIKRGGEFTKKSEADAMDGLAGDLVRDWRMYANDVPTVGFFPQRKHARDGMLKLSEAGVAVEYVDGDTPDDRRREIYRELERGIIKYICNVQVLGRGTDIPIIGCVQLCVAIGSLKDFLQKVGRGSRVHPSKTECICIDHGGNVERHGLFEDEHHWTLDTSTKEATEPGTRPTIACPQCHAIYRGGRCKSCGYEPLGSERKAQGLVFDGTELREYVRKENKEPKKRTCEEMMISALYKAANSGRTYRQACGIAKGLAAKQGTTMRWPKTIEVAGQKIRMLEYGHEDGVRRVSSLFDGFFTRSRKVVERVQETTTTQQNTFTF